MRDSGYPLEWGVGRHGAGNNVFGYFAGPEEFPIEYTAEVMQIDDSLRVSRPRILEVAARPARPVGRDAAAHAALEAHPGHVPVRAGSVEDLSGRGSPLATSG